MKTESSSLNTSFGLCEFNFPTIVVFNPFFALVSGRIERFLISFTKLKKKQFVVPLKQIIQSIFQRKISIIDVCVYLFKSKFTVFLHQNSCIDFDYDLLYYFLRSYLSLYQN